MFLGSYFGATSGAATCLQKIGCYVIFHSLHSLESLQSRCIKAALGLSKFAHHSALLIALGIPRIHEELRKAVLVGLAGIFRGQNHRMRHLMICQLSMLAIDPCQRSDTFLGLAYRLLNNSFLSMLETAGGHVDMSVARSPIASDGVIDTLRFFALHGPK